MYKKILVPLDGSSRAEAIIPHAESMAHCYGASVLFLRVLEPEPILVGPYDAQAFILQPEEVEERLAEIKAYLAGWEGEFREKSIDARHVVARGPVVQSIINVAERENVDLIAMASHGRSGLSRVFYGSVAAGVLQRIDRPLLLVRASGD
ncbi:MAG TPA: universal stress protein [Candidatus Binatia bacterium]|jgi:nucleotide-binding universal stress UspA family protein|nr:universal stress protein [Candidatus Binatia bacterium]